MKGFEKQENFRHSIVRNHDPFMILELMIDMIKIFYGKLIWKFI